MGIPVEILYGEKTFSAVRRSVQEWKEAWPQARVRDHAGALSAAAAAGKAGGDGFYF